LCVCGFIIRYMFIHVGILNTCHTTWDTIHILFLCMWVSFIESFHIYRFRPVVCQCVYRYMFVHVGILNTYHITWDTTCIHILCMWVSFIESVHIYRSRQVVYLWVYRYMFRHIGILNTGHPTFLIQVTPLGTPYIFLFHVCGTPHRVVSYI